jgi:uncharacterized protein (DUF2336 family)
MSAPASLIGELEAAISGGSADKRVETLRRVTDLLLSDADRLNDEQIAVFDDVLAKLIERIETRALVELSSRLAPVDNAPIETIRQLAWSDEIAVAGLTDNDLVEIATSKSQPHLLAISGRRELKEAVTDVLVERGNREVRHTLAKNDSARFSELGFVSLMKSAETDESLAETIGLRLDLPLRLLRDLLLKATEAVRARLLAVAPPATREEIRKTLGKISSEVGQELAAPRDFTRALQVVEIMRKEGTLDETALLAFAIARKYEEVVAALSALCSGSVGLVAPLMRSVRSDGLLIACKAAGLKWPTVKAILEGRVAGHSISELELAQAKNDFLRLSQASAQRTFRFWQVRHGTSKSLDPSSRSRAAPVPSKPGLLLC